MALLLWVVFVSASAFAGPEPLAKVNGEELHAADLARFQAARPGLERAEALDRLILYRLAIQEARRQEWDKEPQTAREIDNALYRSYLRHAVRDSGVKLEPLQDALKAAYEKQPMVRLRVLSLRGTDDKIRAKLLRIRSRCKKEKDFTKQVLKHSQGESRSVGGDLDFRGAQNLPAELYQAARKLKLKEISEPIASGGYLHLVQLTAVQPFAKVPENQLGYLRMRLRNEREREFLTSSLAGLRQRASVELNEEKEKR